MKLLSADKGKMLCVIPTTTGRIFFKKFFEKNSAAAKQRAARQNLQKNDLLK
jgi:hypothetical protein